MCELLPSVFDYLSCGGSQSQTVSSTVLVISPLNAIMKDQIHKLKETGLSVCVLKGEHVDADFVVHFPLIISFKETYYELIPEVFVDSERVASLLKSSA